MTTTTIIGQAAIAKMMQMADDDDELAYTPASTDAQTHDVRPQWMRQLLDASTHWLNMLPKVH